MRKKEINVFTDGSALYTWKGEVRYVKNVEKNASKAADYAGVGVYFGEGDERNVAEPFYIYPTTIRRAEIYAAIKAIENYGRNLRRKDNNKLVIHTDDMILFNTMTNWVDNWKKNGWRKGDGKQPANIDLIYWLYYLIKMYKKIFKVEFRWIKAHQKEIPKNKEDYYYWKGNKMADKYAKIGTTIAIKIEKMK